MSNNNEKLELKSQRIRRVNIYADEVQSRVDPNTNDKWHYIGLVIEDCDAPLLDEIVKLRFCNNFDKKSKYYKKNDLCLHWVDIASADEKNILKRWFDYICTPEQKTWCYAGDKFEVVPSNTTFRFHMLGINSSKLNEVEFGLNDVFGSMYNRFFRTAVEYPLKKFFPNENILIEDIFHEEGSQENNYYFPWHSIYKIEEDPYIHFCNDKIKFLPKEHKNCERSNIIQLCDCFLGASVNILHGMDDESRCGSVKKDILDIYFPLFKRVINKPYNKNSHYKYFRRISVFFFPKEKTEINSLERNKEQFYKNRPLHYELEKSGQGNLFVGL